MDCGDNVIIINADKVQLTGKKWTDRVYLNFTGYPGGQRELSPADLMKKGESKTQVVCDYLAGMTDQYSMAKFRKIYIPKAWEVY